MSRHMFGVIQGAWFIITIDIDQIGGLVPLQAELHSGDASDFSSMERGIWLL